MKKIIGIAMLITFFIGLFAFVASAFGIVKTLSAFGIGFFTAMWVYAAAYLFLD